MMTFLILFIICLALSAFFSGAEMAFVSSNQFKIREKADGGDLAAQKLIHHYAHPQRVLSTILILNNIVNVIATVLVTLFFEKYFKIKNEWVVTGFLVPILLIFGEMAPKDYGRIRSENFLLKNIYFLEFFLKIFSWPVHYIIAGIESMLGRFKSTLHKSIFVSQNEFRMLIEESTRSGVLDEHERQLINTILDFERVPVTSMMLPIETVLKVDINANVGMVKDLARRHKNKMVLVYEELPSIVVGMVYVFDLLFEADEAKGLKNFLRAPIFMPGNTSVEKAFLTLQQKRQSYAIVIDEKLEASGVIAIERLVEF